MDFRIIGINGKKKFELGVEEVSKEPKEYKKPKGANCIMVRGKYMRWGKTFTTDGFDVVETNIGAILLKKTKRAKFFKLPTALRDLEMKMRFPNYYFKPGLHYHGIPEFDNIPIVRIPL